MTAIDELGAAPAETQVTRLCAQLLDELDPNEVDPVTFLGRQFDLGLAWVHFPPGRGGLGLAPKLQRLISRTLRGAGAPASALRNAIGHGLAAPTLLTHGSDEQCERLLRPLFTGEEIWCQLFSEPGAGSDVASLATRAVRDGDEWVVNGQKVWTTLAHISRWGLLVARTDPDVVKHRGLTYFVIDMEAPGVEVVPLYQMTGEAEFNEVFFTDTRIPDSQRLGDVGDGWRVVLTTLNNERVAIGGTAPGMGSGPISEAVTAWHRTDRQDAARRDALMSLWIRAEALRLTNLRAAQMRAAGNPGPEGSIGKAISAELNQDITAMAVDLLGADGMLQPEGYPMTRPSRLMEASSSQKSFLRARANTIEGGSSEIVRNILAERVLALPGDVRVDKDLPWSEVPR